MLLFINVTLKWCPRRWGRSRPAVLARRVVGPPFRPESSDRVGMTKENMEGWKEGTEARNDEPRRGSKNRRAFRETAAAVGERRKEDLGGGEEEASEARGKGAPESDSRGASPVEGTGGRARSGGNSAINTNIFRSVLQPCFDNHPHHARDSAYPPLRRCDSYQAAPLGTPLVSSSAYPPRAARVRPPFASHPSDLKYIDTLTHATERAVPHAYTKRGDVSHPLSPHLPSTPPRTNSPFLFSLATPRPIRTPGLFFYSL